MTPPHDDPFGECVDLVDGGHGYFSTPAAWVTSALARSLPSRARSPASLTGDNPGALDRVSARESTRRPTGRQDRFAIAGAQVASGVSPRQASSTHQIAYSNRHHFKIDASAE
jgi:hypothetical protein